jgi:hypothetical protein
VAVQQRRLLKGLNNKGDAYDSKKKIASNQQNKKGNEGEARVWWEITVELYPAN